MEIFLIFITLSMKYKTVNHNMVHGRKVNKFNINCYDIKICLNDNINIVNLDRKYLRICCGGSCRSRRRFWKRTESCDSTMAFSVITHCRYKQYHLPLHWQLFLIFLMCSKKASKTLRMVVNVKAPLKKYTKTRESTISVESQTPGDITKLEF